MTSAADGHGLIWFECDAPGCEEQSAPMPDMDGNAHHGRAWQAAEGFGWTVRRVREQGCTMLAFFCPRHGGAT